MLRTDRFHSQNGCRRPRRAKLQWLDFLARRRRRHAGGGPERAAAVRAPDASCTDAIATFCDGTHCQDEVFVQRSCQQTLNLQNAAGGARRLTTTKTSSGVMNHILNKLAEQSEGWNPSEPRRLSTEFSHNLISSVQSSDDCQQSGPANVSQLAADTKWWDQSTRF